MPLFRRRPKPFRPPVQHSPLTRAQHQSLPLPGGSNPPSTWNHWLANVGHQVTPTPAMVAVGTSYITGAAKAKQWTGKAWSYCYKVTTTIPKVR